MDKLEPLIKHRFWILLGVCLPLIMFGYMSASGKIKDATEVREGELDEALSSVPDGQLPNGSYAEGLSGINDDFDLEVAVAHHRILGKQSTAMDWPANLAEYVPGEYRGEFLGDAGFIYVDEYENLLQAAYQIAEPIVQDSNGHTGKVSLAYEILPRHEFGADELFVSSERMWDAQEDLWFLRLLLQAVRTMNSSADNIAKSPLRMITQLDLMGGDGQFGSSAVSTFGDGDGAFEMDEQLMDEYEEEDSDAFGSAFGEGEGSFGAASSVSFDPADEFGSSVAVRTTATADGEDAAAAMAAMSSSREEVRYVALDESLPFRERGFYMSVLIDQRRIAEFLITLSNSEWPIRIVRFHVGPNPNGSVAGGYDQFANQGLGGAYEQEMDALDFDEGALDFQGLDTGGFGGSAGYGPRQNFVEDGALSGAFRHPDLVQLEVSGAITFFNPLPEDVLAKVTEALQAASGAPVVSNPEPVEPDTESESTTESPAEPEASELPDASLPVPDETSNQPDTGSSDASTELDDEGSGVADSAAPESSS